MKSFFVFEVSDYSDTNVLGLFVIDSKKHEKKVLGLKFFKIGVVNINQKNNCL